MNFFSQRIQILTKRGGLGGVRGGGVGGDVGG